MYLVQIIENGSVMEQYKTTSKVHAECFLETYAQQVELDGGELFYLTKRTASGQNVSWRLMLNRLNWMEVNCSI